MRDVCLLLTGLLVVVYFQSRPATQSTITAFAPSSNATPLREGQDFFTQVLQDRADMSQRTDVGPSTGSGDTGENTWSNLQVRNGIFSGVTTAGDSHLWLLESGNTNAAPLGRIGTNFPIDANTYTVLSVRLNTSATTAQSFVHSWPNTIFESGQLTQASTGLQQGWNIVTMDLKALNAGSWTGTRRALRFDPVEGAAGANVSVDYARLVRFDQTLCQTIDWFGGTGSADIYLDNDGNVTNGYLGVLQRAAKNTPNTGVFGTNTMGGCAAPSSGFAFNTGVLPPGSYRVFVVALNALPSGFTQSNVSYAPGTFVINETPTFSFVSPTAVGSSDEFFGVNFNDPVDMNKLADIDGLVNVTNGEIVTLDMEGADGSPLGPVRVFRGKSVAGTSNCPDLSAPGDDQVIVLDQNLRGKVHAIDTLRYPLVTVKFGLPFLQRNVFCGTAARLVWRHTGDTDAGRVSTNILFNHRADANVLDQFTVDMNTLSVEGTGQPDWSRFSGPVTNTSTGALVDRFRFDPDEFTPAHDFYVQSVALRDYERAFSHYNVQWQMNNASTQSVNLGLVDLSASGTVDLYYDMDKSGFDGTPIAQGLSAALGSYDWQIPSNLPTSAGTPVYIYAVFSNGTDATCAGAGNTVCNSNRAYAPLPVIMDSNYRERPRLVLSRTSLNFAAAGNTSTVTDPQTVNLSFAGAGNAPCWTISNSNLNFSVSPSSGTGNQKVTVSVVPQTFAGGGSGVATFTVNNGTCGNTMLNPGQQFTATYNITATPQAPTGAVDTPADGATVFGSMGMTGWAIDDIGVTAVKIYRQAVTGEQGDSLGRVYIGDANLVEGARPDIEAGNPTAPFNTRSGWGYLVLTNFLPNQGNGTFVFRAYAYDKDGHEALLGSRTVIAANTTASEPFGAIDTPGQGAEVSGTAVANFGWVLTKGPNRADPPSGGSVVVVWDNVVIGSPGQWTNRADLTSLFPAATYPGIVNALGVFVFDSTAYCDMTHTLSWVVTANNGQAAGIGSRFVTTNNGIPCPTTSITTEANADLGRHVSQVALLDRTTPVGAANGFAIRPKTRVVEPDPTGLRTVYASSLDRVVVDASRPGARRYAAYQVVAGTLRGLPIGATFDTSRGAIYWQPGPGFVGSYDFVVVRDGRERVPVRIVLTPQTSRPPVNPLVRGLFAAGN